MCGIYFCTCCCEINATEILNRGPDVQSKKIIKNSFTLYGCVLHQQGLFINTQPLVHNNSYLLWNGENYQYTVDNDGLILLKNIQSLTEIESLNNFSQVSGPYAAIYIKNNDSIYFGRDVLGRRSLLLGFDSKRKIVLISSTIVAGCSHVVEWVELPALGMFKTSIDSNFTLSEIELYPYDFYNGSFILDELERLGLSEIKVHNEKLTTNYHKNALTISATSLYSDDITEVLEKLLDLLENSVRKRVTHLHSQCSQCIQVNGFQNESCHHSKVAILFSGGIDSAVITVLADRFIPQNESIDLLNVSFSIENKLINESPDRISGLECLKELRLINPNRQWNFVEINVSPAELKDCRQQRIAKLIQPCDSVLDDSIGCALWFAARGEGCINGEIKTYKSPARVVLTGIGADELMAGYSRHRCVFDRQGYEILQLELDKELHRISSRNMGRDDRVISSHGKEGRFPFLDEEVVSFLMSLPIQLKCDLTKERGLGEKMILRLLARDYLKLDSTWANHKRAIQFGSQIAKVERLNKGGKASQKCNRLDIN